VQRYSFFTNQQKKLRRILQNFTKLSVKPTTYTFTEQALPIYISRMRKKPKCDLRHGRGTAKFRKSIFAGKRALPMSLKWISVAKIAFPRLRKWDFERHPACLNNELWVKKIGKVISEELFAIFS
jgi:hypothetical protein